MPRISFRTLGCRLNIAESDALAARFGAAGFEVSGGDADGAGDSAPDVVVVNTCTVTGTADRKSRQALYQAQRAAGTPGGRPLVVATGCFVTAAERGLTTTLPDVDYVVDNDRKSHIFDIVQAHLAGEVVDPAALPADPFGYAGGRQPLHTRATLKVQDGCDNHCSFCIIPAVRGHAVSRPSAEVLAEARQLVAAGFRELVVTGVNIGRYRHHGWDFTDLIEALCELPGEFRVRLSSLEPDPLDQRFVALLAHPKLCPHLHLCLQSGSDRVLLRMRREYDVATYLDLVQRVRAAWAARDAVAHFTTDVMVGFPGETDADFEHTVALCRDVGFGHIHTFRYSPRSETRAARMQEQVPDSVKAERAAIVREVAATGRRAVQQALLGRRQSMLVEEHAGGVAYGYGEAYLRLALPVAAAPARGRMVPVQVAQLTTKGVLVAAALAPATVPT